MKNKEFCFIQSGSFAELVFDWQNHKNDLICAVGLGPWAIDYKRFIKFTEYIENSNENIIVCVLYYSGKHNHFETHDICYFDVEKQKFEEIPHDVKIYYDKQYILITTVKRGFIHY